MAADELTQIKRTRPRRRIVPVFLAAVWGVLMLSGACGGTMSLDTVTKARASNSFQLATSAFASLGAIPDKYTCAGTNISPPLAWSGEPAGTAAFALSIVDPDAPGGEFIHWLVVNIPANVHELHAGETLLAGITEAVNGFGVKEYRGPCPPKGSTHHYRFDLYALRAPIPSAATLAPDALLQLVRNEAIAKSEIVGGFGR